MAKKIAIILNPFSGTSSKKNIEKLLMEKNNGYFEIIFKHTKYAGHAFELVNEAIEEKNEIIVALGGDGTVNEVGSAIYQSGKDVLFGILPGGSGNGFAMHLGLGRDIIKAFETMKQINYQYVDTCHVNNKFFINVSGVGFDARIAYLTKKSASRGFKRYFVTTMKEISNFKPIPLGITIDGDQKIEGEFGLAIVANATMFGYNFTVAPNASISDGLLDLNLFVKAPVWKYIFESYRMLNKTIDQSSIVKSLKGKEILIECLTKDYYHVDGEGYEFEGKLVYGINPRQMKLIVGKSLG